MIKFTPKDTNDHKNVNVAEVSEIKEFVFLLSALLGIIFFLYLASGWALNIVIHKIPYKLEESIISFIDLSQFETDEKFKHQQEHIQSLVDRLSVLGSGIEGRTFSVHIVDEDDANAFAFPGGHIVLFSGLLDQVESQNELAMILGHELGHYAHRDHLRAMGRGLLFTFFSVSLLGSNSGISNFIGSTVNSLDLKYSRAQELAADKYGLDLLNKHYGHVSGSTEFFKRIQEEDKEPLFMHFISTHPVSEQRVKQIQVLIEAHQYSLGDLTSLEVQP